MSRDFDDENNLLDEFGLGGAVQSASVQQPIQIGNDIGFPGANSMFPTTPDIAALQAKLGAANGSEVARKRFEQNRPAVKSVPLSTLTQVGFGPVDIAPGDFMILNTTGHVTFRPQRLIADESIPMSTEIVGMFVGSSNVFPAAPSVGNGISTATFASNQVRSPLSFPMAMAGLPITIQVKNSSKFPVKWSGALFGPMLR